MLRQRIVTALALAGGLGAALVWLPSGALALLFALMLALAGWEWAMLCGWDHPGARLLYVLVLLAALGGVALFTDLPGAMDIDAVRDLLGLAGLWWALALLWVMGYPGSVPLWRAPLMRAAMGVLTLVPPWLALVFLREQPKGRQLILLVIVLVAAADIGAYFAGRAWGRSKLAPRVSPGKSWAGFWGGLGSAAAMAALAWGLLWQQWLEPLAMAVVVACTVPASVLGDLLESMLKRHRGIKDSGQLLPGHGGVLDRIDSLTAAAPVFALLWLLMVVEGAG